MSYPTVFLTLAIFGSFPAFALAIEMPKEISNVQLGMPIEELMKARPAAEHSSKAPLDIEKLKGGKHMLLEKFTDGDFFTASYGIENGKVFTIALMGNARRGKESGQRRQLVKDCVARWGKKFMKRAPEDASRPGAAQPTITWEVEDVEIVLSLPRTRKASEKRPYYASLVFRSVSAAREKPWKDVPMNDGDKKAFFKTNDIDE